MDYEDLGRRVRLQRLHLGWTQERLAKAIGVSTSFVGHIERGTRVLSVDTLERICRTLHITPNMLLSFSSFENLSSQQAVLMEELLETAARLAHSGSASV